jgi:hypothetical protein
VASRTLDRIRIRIENKLSTVAVPNGSRNKCPIAAENVDIFFLVGMK